MVGSGVRCDGMNVDIDLVFLVCSECGRCGGVFVCRATKMYMYEMFWSEYMQLLHMLPLWYR